MLNLTSSQRKILSSAASKLNPLVIIGKNSLTDAIIAQVNKCLNDHELIKVKFHDFKDEKQELTQELCTQTDAALVRIIGNIAILYKESDDPDKQKHMI